ncbi:MAG: PD-(D/E)XK nuclease family protein, partial [Bacteroidia bacterium]
MYKMTEEKNLHSRFIAFLLNPKGTHGKDTAFLKLFLKEFELPAFDLDGVLVTPDEHAKKEEDNIDILITNSLNQAIIIENKIFAGDSDKLDLVIDELNSKNYFLKYQIPRYYDVVVNSKGRHVVSILYLTIDGKKPKFYTEFPKEVNWEQLIICKEYLKHIQLWLSACMDFMVEDSDLKRSIAQYRLATFYFLNDIQLATELKLLTSQYMDVASRFWINHDCEGVENADLVLTQFMHVKWHTVFDFYRLLGEQLEKTFEVQASAIDKANITAVTHRNSRTGNILSFEKNGSSYYICNDQKGFSIGRIKENKTQDDYVLLFDGRYAYFDFTQPEVFKLIDLGEKKRVIDVIITGFGNFI